MKKAKIKFFYYVLFIVWNKGGDLHRFIDEFEGCEKSLQSRQRKGGSSGFH